MYNTKDFTLEENIRFLCGVDTWHTYNGNGKVPTLHLSDGPCGLRKVDENGNTVKSTVMPSISTVANSSVADIRHLEIVLIELPEHTQISSHAIRTY